MQDIPATTAKTSEATALLSSPNWDTSSVDNAAFSNLLAYESSVAQNETPVPAPPQAESIRTRQEEQEAPHHAAVEIKHHAEERDEIKETVRENAERVAEGAPEEVRDEVNARHDLQEMKDVRVDMESFQGMRPQLKRYGLSDEDIATLERKVSSEKGLTWGQLVSYISKNMSGGPKTVDMTAQQQQKLMTFFQKLGFSAPESKQMVADLADGNAAQINAAVQKQLKTLPQDKLAGLDQDELETFKKLLKDIQGQMKAEDRALIRVVGKAMENAMDKARRLAQDQVADKKAASGVETVKVLGEGKNGQVNTDVSKAAVFNDKMPVAEQMKAEAKDQEKLTKSLSTEDQLKAKVGKVEESIAQGAKQGKQQHADSFMKQDDSAAENKAWNEFFEKLRLDESGAGTKVKADVTKGFSEAVTQARTTTATDAAKTLTRAEAPKVLNQVENAILKNLTGGGKRLTLQLTPEQLGTVNIALTVKNSEVSATIRADNTEAAKLIADQLETIKQSLEEQGLKVSKLEVQTQLQGGDQGWQHMAGQDKAFQQGMWGRMRQGMNGNGGSGEMTAEQLSEMAREAILSENGNGLHVVA